MLDLGLGRRRASGSPPNSPARTDPMTTQSILGSNPGLSARALASRKNGARSRGPKTAAGKARSARNALKHGLCAKKLLVLPEEDAGQFRALEAGPAKKPAPPGGPPAGR